MFQIPFEPQSHLPGARRLLAENVLLPTNPHDQRLRYAVLFFLVVDARAVALVVKASFARPMAPDLRPGHVLWKEHVALRGVSRVAFHRGTVPADGAP